MREGLPRKGRMFAAVLLILAAGVHGGFAQEAEVYKGQRLAAALRALQAAGLRIVFTSATVTPDMRVRSEPRAAAPRRRLEDLLAPHGLKARDGPGGIIEIVRTDAARPEPRPADAGTGERVVSAIPRTYTEQVIVSPATPAREDDLPFITLEPGELEGLHGTMADDPLRAIHALPRVAAVDDFRSDFTVRGSPFRHVDLVIDGVSTQVLQHTVYGRGPAGSLSMLGGQVLGRAVLRTGAYPRKYADRLGPQLDLTLREGSREQFGLRGSIGGTNATIVAEGPLGSSTRGSWLVSVRQSYLEWPPEQSESTRNAFGFSDLVAKVVYDVNSRQQLAVNVVGGIANVDEEDDLAEDEARAGTNRASLVNLSWRTTFGSRTVLTQRASVVSQRFMTGARAEQEIQRGANDEIAYRAELVRRIPGGLLEGGAQIARTTTDGSPIADALGGRVRREGWVGAAYVHVAWRPAPSLTLSPGVRLTDSTLLSHATTSWWVLGTWSFRPGWALSASSGLSHQLPGPQDPVRPQRLPPPERATHVDLSVERRFRGAMYCQVTVYRRNESDVGREPDVHPRLVEGLIVPPDADAPASALQGASRGIEFQVHRRSAAGFSGWAAYSYGKTRSHDPGRHETFWANFDQRHALTLFGLYRFSGTSGAAVTFRAGTNVPIPGYLAERDGRLFVGRERNEVRLPAYARLDVRADRRFTYLGRRLTLFGEVLNLLNRRNAGPASGHIDSRTGEAIGFTHTLVRRHASAGLMIEF